MRWAAVLLLAAGSLGALPERLLHNARERTASAREAWQDGDFPTAAAALGQALAAGDADDPALRFNAGTGALGVGEAAAALPLLAEAAAAGGPLAADAFYNLGNAHRQLGDLATAVAAYEESLRRDPGHQAAKHNLELALRQQQSANGGGGEEGDGESEAGGQQSAGDPAADDPGADRPPEGEQPDASGGEGQQEQDQGGPDDGRQGGEQPSRLPGFDEQQDMTAEQAAALLEAVENLEREQRRRQAAEERQRRSSRALAEKDW
ncbi:MAG TPA: tetratricopeptide repeat protein [Thermoanaerobaculia bacterium]|nr:tetratricopeptide repeat protein [Thermoanaerobaculia bacterium]